MPSFLNKVFGYKKHDDKEAARLTREPSDSTLLDGKYEAIPPIVSPTASTFPEAKDPDRDVGFSLFRPKTRGVSQKSAQKHPDNVPHLTLQLPGPKENSDSRSLGMVFEADPESQIVLDDAVIAAKRLNPLEALILIRACAQAITERGLETLGIMHPHWLSASPDVQRRLISLFIHSLTQSQITTLPPTSSSSTSAFENELHYTRSPHDVAAVLRWGLRHLSLENGHFGQDSAEWGWYNAFFRAERNASYPPKGFSELLLPQLPASHAELLAATLSLISSLASHAEANSISGSKLSKFLGLWLLVATRAEQHDDWDRFYARWERAGRILEHLFLIRLREESFGLRLPTRLQELVKHYPYNKGDAVDDDLLSRPRFSTRQYDALFVRVESVLAHGGEQPKQHPIRLLLEAFQLPIDISSGDEHIALWNTLKSTAFEGGTSSGSEGPQLNRIFVDETIHLLSLIPADNNLPTSPTLLTSPIPKVVSSKRSSPLTKAFDRAFFRSNANDGSTPVSPTSPSSIVVTDWAQFALSGFGDAPTTQPLAALLSQDDDVEITQPRISRKSSRHKSRTGRRHSEDREPSDTPSSSHSDPEPSIVETKLASVHMVQIDEAFVDFWSDAIVDPIAANWPTFVVCGLKEIPSVEQPIRWLVIEQAYSRQEPQTSRVPSPDGRRGRSPRPSFKSDISGFRINSVFSSARKRFSVFSKSATDLDLKKSGGKTPVAGELGEVLVEEESALPLDPPTQAGLHVDGNASVRTNVTSAVTVDVADQLEADEISTAPIAAAPPALAHKGGSGPVYVGAKAHSIEPTPQSGGWCNGSSLLPRPSLRASEETITVGRDSPRNLDVVNPEVNTSATPVTKIAPLAAEASESRSTHGVCDPAVLASEPASSPENLIAEEVCIQAEQVQQGVTAEAEDRPVKLVTQKAGRDEHLHADSTGELSNVVQAGAAGAVAMPPTLETVVSAVATPVALPAVGDEPPEPTFQEPHVAKAPSQTASADPVAAFTDDFVGQHEIDDLSPVSGTEVIAAETGAQAEPHVITSVVNEVKEAKEVAEFAEIPTPAPELVALIEETPGREVSLDVCGSASKPEALDGAGLQLEAPDDAASQPLAAELQEAPFVPPVGTSMQVVAVETEHAAGQVPELAAEEVQLHVQDTIVQAPEERLIEALSSPKVEADISAGTDSASHQAEDVAPAELEAQTVPESFLHEDRIVETQGTGTPTPVLEHARLVDETTGSDIAVDAHEPVEAAPPTTPEFEEVEAKTQDPVAEAVVGVPVVDNPLAEEVQPFSEAELPTQINDMHAAEALSTGSNPEATTAALATVDEVIAAKVETTSTPDAPAEEAEALTPGREKVLIEDTLEVTNEPTVGVPSSAADPKPVEDRATEPIAEEAQDLVKDAAPIASEPVAITPIVTTEEPVAHDVLAPIDQPLSEPASQFVDEAVDPPIVAVPVPDEISAVEVEVQLESQVVPPTADTVDEPVIEDTESASLASESGVLVEETRVIVDAREPETLATEPELVKVSASVTIVEDAPAPVEAEETFPVVVEDSEEDAASQPEVEINETQVSEPQQVVDLAEQPLTIETDVSPHEPAEEIAPVEP